MGWVCGFVGMLSWGGVGWWVCGCVGRLSWGGGGLVGMWVG